MSTGDELAETRLARLALARLAEPGNLAMWTSVNDHGAVRVLQGLLAGDNEQLLQKGVGARLAAADPRRRAEASLAHARRLGARVVIPEDGEWPHQLDDLITICDRDSTDPIARNAAPPLCLWVRGPWRLDGALSRAVAVVGARGATGYGVHAAREIGYGLAERDWTAVSGGAFGIDAYAHRGALAAGGITVAVLACGVDRAYPVSHAGLFDRVAEEGLLVSEWPPGTDPFRHRFLIRNRVIAAMAGGTVVVEASARSGALQTLRRAGQLGRHRMAVPGPITSSMSVGCHEQLRDPEVHLVAGVPHILELVGRMGTDLAAPARGPEHPRDHLGADAQRLLEALLARKPLSSEEVAARAGVDVREAMRILPDLAYQGLAQRRGSGYLLSRGRAAPEQGCADGDRGAAA